MKGERFTLIEVQERPLSIADIEARRHIRAIFLCGLLVGDNAHMGYRPGCGGRQWVAIRLAGAQAHPVICDKLIILTPKWNAQISAAEGSFGSWVIQRSPARTASRMLTLSRP